MNPCPCGYFGSKDNNCLCKPEQIKKYINKISGPLLDRIDLHIEVQKVQYQKLSSNKEIENSEQIRKRVNNARKIQLKRYKNEGIYSNSELMGNQIDKYCKLDSKGNLILQKAFETLNLSARAYNKILKVARTIADLENSENIQLQHIAEAIQYRTLDRKYWKKV